MSKRIFATLLAILAFAAASQAQENASPPNPAYDAELAKKLGADDRGMRQYVLAILKTGPNDSKYTGDERKKMFAGHFASINRWADEGKLIVAGPFGKNDRTFRGLYLFAVSSAEEAQAIAEKDPAIKNGIFIVEYTPWYGSASLMATPELHKKLHKYKE